MRIIAGEFRGRRLLAPDSDITRPVTDRVKQSVFDILMPLIPGARVYDCFAGTGSMGLECLSRGASHVTFFEADRAALKRLRDNITTVNVGKKSLVIPGDLFQWFQFNAPASPVDLIFLDPPYRFLTERPKELTTWANRAISHLSPDGLVIFRHDTHDTLDLSPLVVSDTRAYGSMTVEFLTPPQQPQGKII